MSNIAIVYYSQSGHTKAMADLLAASLGDRDCQTRLIDVCAINDTDWQAMDAADAILFGSPTFMGGVAAPFKQFMDDSAGVWEKRQWVDKIAAGFTVAVHPAGDKLAVLSQLCVFAMQHGMVWVGNDEVAAPIVPENIGINRQGVWLGLDAVGRDVGDLLDLEDRETIKRFAGRIARAVRRWRV